MKFSIVIIMRFFCIMLCGVSLSGMDKLPIFYSIECKGARPHVCPSLKEFEKGFQKTWDCYSTEEGCEPAVKICFFDERAVQQREHIYHWIESSFPFIMKTKNSESWMNDDHEEGLAIDNNFIRIVSNTGSQRKICIDDIAEGNKTCLKEKIPVVVLSVDTDTSSFPEELFSEKKIKKPTLIVVNTDLLLKKNVMDALRYHLESLGDSYEADKALKELKKQQKDRFQFLYDGRNWPKDLEEKMASMFSRHMPAESPDNLITLCFLDSLSITQQKECIRYWIKEKWRLCRNSWFYSTLNLDDSSSAIQLVSGDTIDSILMSKDREKEDFQPNTELTILSLNSADDINDLLPLIGNRIKIPLIIVINESLLYDECFVTCLFEGLIGLPDEGGILECLEILKDKCPNSKSVEKANSAIKYLNEKKEKKRKEYEEQLKKEAEEKKQNEERQASTDKALVNPSRIFAYPITKYIIGIGAIGLSVTAFMYLQKYFKGR